MINEIEIYEVLLEKIPLELCKIILSFSPSHNYIKELKKIKKYVLTNTKNGSVMKVMILILILMIMDYLNYY